MARLTSRHTAMAGNFKIAHSEKIALLLHRHVDVPCSLVVTYNLSLDGKLCLRDDKNAAFVYLHHLLPWEASLENITMCVRISRKPFLIGESTLFGDHVSLRLHRKFSLKFNFLN